MEKIKDFGEHIGGAKKENWRRCGLTLRDLEEMNAAERAKYVTKDSVWPKSDYRREYNSPGGRDRLTLYCIKLVRDSLPVSPDRPGNAEEQEDYIKRVSYLKRIFETECIEYSDILDSVRKANSQEDVLWAFPKLGKTLAKLGRKGELEREIRKKEFLYTEDEKLMKYYCFLAYDPAGMHTETYLDTCLVYRKKTMTFYFYPDKTLKPDLLQLKEGEWFAVKNSRVTLTGFGSRQEAYEACLAIEKAAKAQTQTAASKKNGKSKYRPPHLEHVRREGGKDILKGGKVTGEDIMNAFAFRGGEFGNWVSDKERQLCMNMAYESLYDLAGALSISNTDIGFSGALAIAFGARGQGSAAAHYEPLREVINLTKMSGAGSLAHEWIHALDDHLGKELKLGGMLTEHMKAACLPESFANLMQTIKKRQYSPEETLECLKKNASDMKLRFSNDLHAISRKHDDADLEEKRKMLIAEVVAESSDPKMREFFRQRSLRNPEMTPAYAAFAGFQKEHGDSNPSCKRNVAWSAAQQVMLSAQCSKLTGEIMSMTGDTNFYKDAVKLGGALHKSGGYWESDTELLARAGAAYIKDKCLEKGVRNDYLTGHADAGQVPVKGGYAFISPQGEERKAINAAFDSFFEELKELGLLKTRSEEDDAPFRIWEHEPKEIDENLCRQVTIYEWFAAAAQG